MITEIAVWCAYIRGDTGTRADCTTLSMIERRKNLEVGDWRLELLCPLNTISIVITPHGLAMHNDQLHTTPERSDFLERRRNENKGWCSMV